MVTQQYLVQIVGAFQAERNESRISVGVPLDKVRCRPPEESGGLEMFGEAPVFLIVDQLHRFVLDSSYGLGCFARVVQRTTKNAIEVDISTFHRLDELLAEAIVVTARQMSKA